MAVKEVALGSESSGVLGFLWGDWGSMRGVRGGISGETEPERMVNGAALEYRGE